MSASGIDLTVPPIDPIRHHVEGTDMGRHSLRIIMVLGALVTLVGGTGIFAVFTDRATGGDNTVTSGTRPKSADLRIEPAVLDAATGTFNCDGDLDGLLWQNDDTTTAQYTVADVQPGNSPATRTFA
jgi:predicted ribosomally synthesized peptide with SipW-like signal peptide